MYILLCNSFFFLENNWKKILQGYIIKNNEFDNQICIKEMISNENNSRKNIFDLYILLRYKYFINFYYRKFFARKHVSR